MAFVPRNVVVGLTNPLTSDLAAASFDVNGATYVRTNNVECETIENKLPQTFVEMVCDYQMAPGTEARIEELKLNAIPNVATVQSLYYNSATKEVSYGAAPAGGGSVVGVNSGTNITVDNTNPALPIVNLATPLTSNLNMGTQDITTTTINTDIQVVPTTVDGTTLTATKALEIACSGTNPGSAPALRLTTTNATGGVGMEVYQGKPGAGGPGEELFRQSVFGKDSSANKQEYTRITHTIREATAGTEDGSMELGVFNNGSYNTYVALNGNDAPAGEINILKPLDLLGAGTTGGLIKVSGAGSTDININGTTSAGFGAVNLTAKGGATLAVATGITGTAATGGNINFTTPAGAGAINLTSTGNTVNLNGGNGVNITTSAGFGGGNVNISSSVFGDVNITGNDRATLTGRQGLRLDTIVAGSDIDIVSVDRINLTGSLAYLSATSAGPYNTVVGYIPIVIGGITRYIPYYSI